MIAETETETESSINRFKRLKVRHNMGICVKDIWLRHPADTDEEPRHLKEGDIVEITKYECSEGFLEIRPKKFPSGFIVPKDYIQPLAEKWDSPIH